MAPKFGTRTTALTNGMGAAFAGVVATVASFGCNGVRYGKLPVDELTAGKVAASTFVNETAERGALIAAETLSLHWKAGHDDDFELLTATDLLDEGVTTSNLASEVTARLATHARAESYLVISRRSLSFLDAFGYSSRARLVAR